MRNFLFGMVAALALPAVLLAQFAQDTRLEPPKTPAEWWRAVTFELNTGNYDAAGFYMKGFLDSNPSEKDLVDIEATDGLAGFLRLRNVVTWSTDKKLQEEARKNAEEIIKRVTEALEKQLGDQQRIGRFIANLRGSDDERYYAVRELQRSGARAIPALVAALRADTDPTERAAILNLLPLMPEEAVAPLLAALDMKDSKLKYQILESLGQRKDFAYLSGRTETNPLPTLDYLAASPNESEQVRQLARSLITRLRPISRSEVRPATTELVEAAWKFYRHQEKFVKPATVPVWRYEDNQVVQTPSTATQAEEYYALRYARWALELDPNSIPAQVAFLSAAIDKTHERTGLEAALAKVAPEANDLLHTVGVNTLIATLDQAIIDRRTSVALGVTRALAQRGEVKAGLPTRYRAGVLQRALDYPDPRVQLAAAEALIKLPGTYAQQNQAKIIEILRRALAAETAKGSAGKPRVIVGHFDTFQAQQWGRLLSEAGYDPIYAQTAKELLARLRLAGDIDAVVIDGELPYPPLVDLLATLRYDVYLSSLPVRVVHTAVDPAKLPSTQIEATLNRVTPRTVAMRIDENNAAAAAADRIRRLTDGWPGVAMLRAPLTAQILKTSLVQVPGGETGPALTATERKAFAAKAIELLRLVGPEFDLKPAGREIRQALMSPDLAKGAIEVAARLPGRDAQVDLARLVLDEGRPPEIRNAAAEGLVKHYQRFGLGLTSESIAALDKLAAESKDLELRGRVAAIVGALNIDGKTTGQRLRNYVPPKPGAEAKPAEKGPEKPANPPKKPDDDPDDKY